MVSDNIHTIIITIFCFLIVLPTIISRKRVELWWILYPNTPTEAKCKGGIAAAQPECIAIVSTVTAQQIHHRLLWPAAAARSVQWNSRLVSAPELWRRLCCCWRRPEVLATAKQNSNQDLKGRLVGICPWSKYIFRTSQMFNFPFETPSVSFSCRLRQC